MDHKNKHRRPVSLQFRMVVLAALLLAISLGLVGYALDATFHKSSEAGLQARMESLVYLVLGAIEVTEDGQLLVENEPADPRLGQTGSGIYALAYSDQDEWVSSSSLGVNLPSPGIVQSGEHKFQQLSAASDFYIYQYAVSWELADDSLLPVRVNIFVDARELQPELQAFRKGLWQSLVATGLILVLAQMILLALGLRPLRRITQDISGIESGKLKRIEEDYPKELEGLKRNLNHLLDTEEANQTRYRNALDSLAHSLKTPLSVIRSSLPANGASKNDAIENSVSDMQRLIATRLQRAAASTRRSMAPAVDVQTQVERVVKSLEQVYSQKMINIDVNIESGLAFYGEQRDLLELSGNLLDNACKYGNGQIQISASMLDADNPRAGIRLQVDDNGEGIDEAKRESLLQRGVRGDERVEGHGLGLSIVVEIVSAYLGEIEIGQSEMGGARVTVRLKTS